MLPRKKRAGESRKIIKNFAPGEKPQVAQAFSLCLSGKYHHMGRGIKILYLFIAFGVLFWGQPSLAAEKSKLAFVRGGDIWIGKSDGAETQQLTYSRRDRGPAVSADGLWVAFYSGVGEETGFGQVLMIPSKGGLAQQFRHPEIQGAEQPTFSPDGGSILFVGLSDLRVKKGKDWEQTFATMSLCLADLHSGDLRRIISHPNAMLDAGYVFDAPAFSPDGQLIAYQESGSDVSGGFVVINLQGKRVFRFPKNPRDATPYWRPQFSRNGKEILCYSPAVAEGQTDVIYLVNLENSRKRKIAVGSCPTFVDRGKAIVYEKWPPDRWTAKGLVKADLWRLELAPGAKPRKIITDGVEPAG